MEKTEKIQKSGKKSFKMPHAIVIMVLLMLFVTLLTYIVPSGQFAKAVDPNTKRQLITPGSFKYMPKGPGIGIIEFFSTFYTGFVEGGTIIGSLLIISGCLAVLESTGTFAGGISTLVKKSKGKEFSMVVIFYTVFVIFGALGYGEGSYPFYPIVVGVIMALGYDRITGAAVALVGSTVGFTAGLVNMFTTGISQQIAGLPLFSGIEYRVVTLAVLYFVGLLLMYSYTRQIKKDPSKSYTKDEYINQKAEISNANEVELNTQRKLGLLGFLVLVTLQGYGALNWKWGLAQISGIYIIYAIFIAVIFKINSRTVSDQIVLGAQRMLGAAIIIGLSRSITVLLNAGNILDTFVYYMSEALNGQGPAITLLIILLFVALLEFLIGSGSGKAMVIMPIVSPLGHLLKINQQVLVLTYQIGDGLTNSFYPTGGVVSASLCGLEYLDWMKYFWKTFVALLIAGYAMILIANQIGYGPF